MQLIAILMLSALVFCSLGIVIPILTPEKELPAMTRKIKEIDRIRFEHICGIASGILAAFVAPSVWPVHAAIVGYCLLVIILVTMKRKKLTRDMIRKHDEDAIFILSLGTVEGHAEGNPIKLRFKAGSDSWPLALIEIGVSHYNHPLHLTYGNVLNECCLSRLADALGNHEFEPILLAMKNDLTAHGITHPIDIRGWDHHPVIRDFVERIMDAQPEQP